MGGGEVARSATMPYPGSIGIFREPTCLLIEADTQLKHPPTFRSVPFLLGAGLFF